jgi:hypothetical protein
MVFKVYDGEISLKLQRLVPYPVLANAGRSSWQVETLPKKTGTRSGSMSEFISINLNSCYLLTSVILKRLA